MSCSERDRPLPPAGAPGAAEGLAPAEASEVPTEAAGADGFESDCAALGLQAGSGIDG